MDISQNHVHYDASSHTLTVTTFYDLKTYWERYFKKIVFHGSPSAKGEFLGNSFSPGFMKAVFLVFAVIALLQFSTALQDGRIAYHYLVFALFWVAFAFFLEKFSLWLWTTALPSVFRNTGYGHMMPILRHAFAKQPIHQQTAVITKSTVSADPIFFPEGADKPQSHGNTFAYFHALSDGIYLITFLPLVINGQVKNHSPIMSQSYYFNKAMYSEQDWAVLVSAFQDLGYSN